MLSGLKVLPNSTFKVSSRSTATRKKWSAGPHLFVDDKQIWVFTPLTVSGVHSPSFNKRALGVEMLGDYETEKFDSGRGLKVGNNAIAALATLSAVLGLDPTQMKLHKEDPETTHNCPGKNVRKLEVIQAVQDLIHERHGGEHPMGPSNRPPKALGLRKDRVEVMKTADWIVNLGPEGGDAGGPVVAVGTPEAMRPALGLDPRVAANQASYTGQYFKQVFERRRTGRAKRAAAAE